MDAHINKVNNKIKKIKQKSEIIDVEAVRRELVTFTKLYGWLIEYIQDTGTKKVAKRN